MNQDQDEIKTWQGNLVVRYTFFPVSDVDINYSSDPKGIWCKYKDVEKLFNERGQDFLLKSHYQQMIEFYKKQNDFLTKKIRKLESQESDRNKRNKRKLKKITGKSTCPFCGGTKTLPFTPRTQAQGQHCNECDKDGKILNSKLSLFGLDDMIEYD